MEDRSWAEGLDEEEFVRLFMQKYPKADAIPLVGDYVTNTPKEGRGIDPYNEELLEQDNVRSEKMSQGLDKLTCCGCDRKFTAEIGRISHERRCKKALQIPMETRTQLRTK